MSGSPLPADAEATRKLSASIAAASKAPPAKAVPEPPDTAQAVSGRRYDVGSNPFGWDGVRLSFGESEASLEITIGAATTAASVGLDSVPRITRDARFSTQARHADIDVAMAGRWIDENTFEVTFDTIDTIDAGTLSFAFHDGA